MCMNKINFSFSFFILSILFCVSKNNLCLAASPLVDPTLPVAQAMKTGQTAGFNVGQKGFGYIIDLVIKGFLGLLGLIFIILVIIAGYNWMTAGGDEAKVTKAKSTIQRATIGLIIIIASYAITAFVFKALDGVVQ